MKFHAGVDCEHGRRNKNPRLKSGGDFFGMQDLLRSAGADI